MVATQLLDFDTAGKNVYYLGTANNGLDRQLYKTELKSGKTTQLTKTSGTHTASISSDGTYIFDNFTNATTPNDFIITNTKSNKTNNQ